MVNFTHRRAHENQSQVQRAVVEMLWVTYDRRQSPSSFLGSQRPLSTRLKLGKAQHFRSRVGYAAITSKPFGNTQTSRASLRHRLHAEMKVTPTVRVPPLRTSPHGKVVNSKLFAFMLDCPVPTGQLPTREAGE